MHTPGRTRTGPKEQGGPVEVLLRWGGDVVDVRRLGDDVERLRVGSRVEDDLCVPLDDLGSFDLLVRTAGGFELRAAPGMRGSIRRGHAWAEVSPSMGAFVLLRTDGEADDVEARLVLGAFLIEVRVGERARGVHLAPLFDALWANTATVTMLAMAAVVAMATLLPRGAVGDDEGLITDRARITRLIPVTRSWTTTSPPPPSSESSASRPKRTRPRPAAEPAERAEQRVAPASARAALALDAVGQDGGFGSALGRGGVADALVDALAAVHGTESAELGASGGGGGIVGGLLPTGSASGAVGVGTIGIGRVGTRGRGAGLDGTGGADAGFTTKTEREVPGVELAVAEPRGFDKELIRRVVKEHQSQVRYCYERALQRRPGLAGKVTVRWVIDVEGRALQAQARGFDDDVDDCLERRVGGWRFPKLGAGAAVVVSYPFVFKPS